MNVSTISPKVVVTSGLQFWRTPELNEASAVAKDLEAAKADAKDDLVVSGSFFQETKAAKLGRLFKSAAKVAVPALAATGLLVAGAAAGPALMLAGGLGIAAGFLALAEGPNLKRDIEDYTLARQYQQFEGLDVWRDGGPPAELKVERTSPPEAGLREMLTANMKDFPHSFHVMHANGHGLGGKYTAGLPSKVLGGAVTSATNAAGRQVDVALLDTCYGSNFESLMGWGYPGNSPAKFVVAFQDAIPNSNSEAGKIPLREMLTESTDETSARDIAVEMATIAGKYFDKQGSLEISGVPVADRLKRQHLAKLRLGTDSTVAAIDVEALQQKLHPALDKAGVALKQSLQDPTYAAAIQEAKKKTTIESAGDLIDLGGFLTELRRQAKEDSTLRQSLDQALKALDDSLLYKRTGQKYPLSGLSVHTRENPGAAGEIAGQPTRPLDGEHLPKGWVDFIKQAF